MSFKSANEELLYVASTGNQELMELESWSDHMTPLVLENEYEDILGDGEKEESEVFLEVTKVGIDENGSFWNEPFSGADGQWNVKG